MVERKEYLEELKRWKEKDLIKVVTGIRRCGKSTLFDLFIDYLKSIGVSEKQIIKINLEDADYDFKDYKELYNYIKTNLIPDKMNYVFLDEVQNVPEFQRAVDSLYIKKNVDVYITGSNAYLLSGELATLLSGRYIEIKMLPLSFKEYVSAFPNNNNYYQLFLEYMRFVKVFDPDYLILENVSGMRSTAGGQFEQDIKEGKDVRREDYLVMMKEKYILNLLMLYMIILQN